MTSRKYQRLTPLRAMDLLEKVDRHRQSIVPTPLWLLNDVADALRNHVKAELTKKRPRRKR